MLNIFSGIVSDIRNMARSSANSIVVNRQSIIMYVDMNSYFASCEQQLEPALRSCAMGVCAYVSNNAAVLAASKEAKRYGIKTGMRVSDCKILCPEMIFVPTRPVKYRQFHVQIMNILRRYCDDVIPKSIDEAVVNLTKYKYLYKDFLALGKKIKQDITAEAGECLTCSVGISGNVFLAKLATEMQKPDGLFCITPENLDECLSRLNLIDLPGIGNANERRLKRVGIRTPLDMRNASESLLRKVFGGVVGNYWYARLHFGEVDLYTSQYKTMSATRSISKEIRTRKQSLMALLIALATKLEQRMVKQGVFCKDIHFFAGYYNHLPWETAVSLRQPIQDGMELMQHIMQRINVYEKDSGREILCSDIKQMGIAISGFVEDKYLQYSLFDNNLQKNHLRKVVYQIKDKYGKNVVRKASEIMQTGTLKDAIGFGSVKDLYELNPGEGERNYFNQYLLEDGTEYE